MPKGKILVIDDDPDIALATRLVLEKADYLVVEARSSAEGLAKVKSETPDLIVLDVMMESTTAGFQTALALRSRDPNSEYKAYSTIPIIMLTSIHSTTPVRFGPEEDYLPVDEFIEKPLDPEMLVQKVDALLAK
ncbi:MAG: response regulator [Anaerolineae bacterium]|nr:response regulator [Anaerolineae bacterium]